MPAIRVNPAKQKLLNNQVVTIIMGPQSADAIDSLGPLGFDAAWIECEHGPVDWDTVGDMTRACDLWGMTSITRVNANAPGLITRTLDRGSMGIVVPHVNTRAAAEQAMQSSKYAPLGHRGMYPGRQAYGVADYFHQANGQTMVIVLLEEAEALRNLDEILTVDNIDVFFIAPSDLAQTMGHLGDHGHPEVQAAIDDGLSRIISAGRTAGTLVNLDNVASYLEKGVRCVAVHTDSWVARGGAEFLGKVSSASR